MYQLQKLAFSIQVFLQHSFVRMIMMLNILKIDRGILRQCFATFTMNLGVFAVGTVVAWTSAALVSLDEEFKDMSTFHKSWISSINHLGGIAACLIGSFVIDFFGRKTSAILFAIPGIFGWVMLFLAQNIPMLYVSRFILGFSTSFAGVVGPVFVSEISESNIRGTLSSMNAVFYTGGMLFSYTVGNFVSWQVLSMICGGVPILMLLLLWILPESPRHLFQIGKDEEATKSFCWYRGTNSVDAIAAELKSVRESISQSSKENKTMNFMDLKSPKALKPLLICIVLFLIAQLSGYTAIVAFTAEIFDQAGLESNSNLMTIVLGIFQFLTTCCSCLLIDKVGRRRLLFIGQIGLFASLCVLGSFFHFKAMHGEQAVESLRWIPVASLLAYIVSFCIGIGPVSTTLMGELIPQNIRGIGSAICNIVIRLSAFSISLTFGDIQETLGSQYCFWIFAAVCLVGVFMAVFIIPETKGRSLEEIENIFL